MNAAPLDSTTTLVDLLGSFVRKWSERNVAPELLIIDDDPADLILMQRAANRIGWKVYQEHTGLEAIATYKKQLKESYWLAGYSAHPFDMVILDLKLPDLPGSEVFAAIKAVHRSQPIAIVTGYADQFDLNAMAKIGYAGLVLKPLSLAGLEEVLAAHNLPVRAM